MLLKVDKDTTTMLLINATLALLGAFCILHEDCATNTTQCVGCFDNKCTLTSEMPGTYTVFTPGEPLCVCTHSDECRPLRLPAGIPGKDKICKTIVGRDSELCVDYIDGECRAVTDSKIGHCNKFGQLSMCKSNTTCTGDDRYCTSRYRCASKTHGKGIEVEGLDIVQPNGDKNKTASSSDDHVDGELIAILVIVSLAVVVLVGFFIFLITKKQS